MDERRCVQCGTGFEPGSNVHSVCGPTTNGEVLWWHDEPACVAAMEDWFEFREEVLPPVE
jgi:hypothetical protein